MTPAAAIDIEKSDKFPAYNPSMFRGTPYVNQNDENDDRDSEVDAEKNISSWGRKNITMFISANAHTKEIDKSENVVPFYKKYEKHSIAYANLILERNLSNMLAHFENLRANLQNPEGAQAMAFIRENIKNVWKLKESLPRQKVIIISAFEEAIKNRRWRDLTLGQVGVLETIIKNLLNSTVSLESVFRSIQKNGIDIYPSVENEMEESNGEEQ